MLAYLVAAVRWTLVVGGDVMLNEVHPSPEVFKGISELVRSADLAYANLEVPLTNSRTPTLRKTLAELRARSQFILKADPRHAPYLAAAGFDAASLANNHALDFRAEGLTGELQTLDKLRIGHFGAGRDWAEARRTWVREVAGIRVGFIAFLSFNSPSAMWKCTPATEDSSGIAALTITGEPDEKAIPIVRKIVETAKKDCDLLAVCLHWGIERQPQPAANQVRLGRMFIDQGADLVLGAHPHVLEPGELYKRKPIIYSLGNLVFPRSGPTALYRFRYDGTTLKGVDYLPALISGGKVALTTKIPVKPSAALQAENTLRKRFPSKNSGSLIGMQ